MLYKNVFLKVEHWGAAKKERKYKVMWAAGKQSAAE